MTESQQTTPEPKQASAPTVRPAVLDDAEALYELIAEASRTTTVLPRERENIIQSVRDFVLVEFEGRIIGCGALALFTRTLAEVRSLVVAADWRGRGVGSLVVGGLVKEATRLGVRRLFALTDSPHFFERNGFKRVAKESLPHKVWNDCVFCPKFLHCTEEAVDMILSPINEPGNSPSEQGMQ
ncbi:N-acetyltransferase [bacterium]|nr:N-acetyltransferase [bacterium]